MAKRGPTHTAWEIVVTDENDTDSTVSRFDKDDVSFNDAREEVYRLKQDGAEHVKLYGVFSNGTRTLDYEE